MKISPLLYVISIFVFLAASVAAYIFGNNLKTAYTWVDYNTDFLAAIDKARNNTSPSERSFIPGVVQRVDTTKWLSLHTQQPCVLAHMDVILRSKCECRKCNCYSNYYRLLDTLSGSAFNLISGTRSVFVSDSLWLGRYRTDADSLYEEGAWKKLPEQLANLKMRKVKLGPLEIIGGYMIRETPVQEGDSVSLFTYVDGNKILNTDTRKPLLIGGYNAITSRLAIKLKEAKEDVKNAIILLAIASIFVIQGVVVYIVDRKEKSDIASKK